jgi:pyruvate carboxylase subunit B
MPGGALTANTQMMRDHGILDRYQNVADAMTTVVAKGGFGTSVTPVSQFYFQQAFNNVMFGPWQRFADGYGKMVLGYFGKTPMPPDPEIVRLASQQLGLEPTDRPPIDINGEDSEKGIAAARQMLEAEDLHVTDENIFIAATCKEKGVAFLKGDARVQVRKKERVDPGCAEDDVVTYTVTVAGRPHQAVVEGNTVTVDGVSFDVAVAGAPGAGDRGGAAGRAGSGVPEPSPQTETPAPRGNVSPEPGAAAGAGAEGAAGTSIVKAPFSALLLRVEAPVGTCVNKGDTVVVLESMKMETELGAPMDGTVAEIHFAPGDQIASGSAVATIRPL